MPRAVQATCRRGHRPREELAGIDAKWVLFKASYEEILRAYPDPYNLGALRAMACIAGKKEDYKAITQRVTGTAPSVAWFDTPQKQRDCDDGAFRNKSFSPARLTGRMWGPLIAMLPVIMGALLTLLRVFGRRAGSASGSTANNPTVKSIAAPVDGMAEIGVPVDQSWRHVLAQLLRVLGVVILVLLALFAAWRAFQALK